MIERRAFGSTGHLSSATIFGAAALSDVSQAEADTTMELVLSAGVNHIDTANSYGRSEERLGPWTGRYRSSFFLATKSGDRSYAGAKEQLQRSLELLKTDHIDLWQLHNLVDEAEWQQAMGPGGALEAFIEAKEQGLVRFLGVTGHGLEAPAMHRRSLERYPFDAVLLPYNYTMMQNQQYAADFEALAQLCEERAVAMQTIKAITLGPWGEKPRTDATWYEPLHEQEDIDLAVNWVLARPKIFLNTVGDINILPKVFDAAGHLSAKPSDEEMDKLVAERGMQPLFS